MCILRKLPSVPKLCDDILRRENVSLLECNFTSVLPPLINEVMDVQNSYHPNLNADFDFNYSDFDFPNEIWDHRPDWEIATKIVIIIPFIIIGVIGNAVVVSVVIHNKSLRTPTNLLLANMAAADLLTLLICPVLFLCSDIFQNYITGKFGCKSEGFFNCTLLLTAVANLCGVSYDRLTAIALPPEAKLNRHSTHVLMIVTWVIGFISALPLVIFRNYTERQWKNFHEKYCSEDKDISPIYWQIILTLLVWIPLGLTTICYTTIFIKLHQYEKKVKQKLQQVFVNYKMRVARTTFIILLVFISCRGPYTALIYERALLLKINNRNQVTSEFHILWFVSRYLLFINAALNPIIYGFTNESFRRAFRLMPVSKWLCGKISTDAESPLKAVNNGDLIECLSPVQTSLKVKKEGKTSDEPQHWFVQPRRYNLGTLSTNLYM